MKRIIIFLILIILTYCQISHDKREIIRKRRIEDDKIMKECILTNESASPELKKLVEETEEGELRITLHPAKQQHLPQNDHDIIKSCRKKIFEEHIKQREKEREKVRHARNEL